MKTKKALSIIIVLFLFVPFSTKAQLDKIFLNGADKNIKRVTVFNVDANETLHVSYIYEFDKKGNLIKESQPESHILVEYKYDKQGKLFEKEALYGESFANGITTYEYKKGMDIEKNSAMGFYSEHRKEKDEEGNIIKEAIFYVAGGMGESKIENIEYIYNKQNQLDKVKTKIVYYDLNIEIGEIPDSEPTVLIKKLKKAKVLKEDKFIENYNYNTKKLLVSKQIIDTNSNKTISETTYTYNQNDLLIKEKTVCTATSKSLCKEKEVELKYNSKTQVESVMTSFDLFFSIESYNQGRLIDYKGRYSATDDYRQTYKYEYYKN